MSKETEHPSLTRTFFSGAATRLIELPIGHVLETARVLINANPTRKAVVGNFYSQEGLKGFYRGLSWNLLAASLKTGSRWLNTTISDRVISPFISEDYKFGRAALIAASASLITVSIYCPLEGLKVLAMTENHLQKKEKISLGNYRTLFRGWQPMYVKEATISILFNTSYIQSKELVARYSNTSRFNIYHHALTGALAGSFTSVITTPFDFVKDNMQKVNGVKENNLFSAAKLLYQRYGLFPMIKAMPVKVARSGWYFAATTAAMHQLNALPKYMRIEKKSPGASSNRPKI